MNISRKPKPLTLIVLDHFNFDHHFFQNYDWKLAHNLIQSLEWMIFLVKTHKMKMCFIDSNLMLLNLMSDSNMISSHLKKGFSYTGILTKLTNMVLLSHKYQSEINL